MEIRDSYTNFWESVQPRSKRRDSHGTNHRVQCAIREWSVQCRCVRNAIGETRASIELDLIKRPIGSAVV